MNEELIKNLQILFALSPLFLGVILTALAIKNLTKKMSKYSIFWLIGFIIVTLALTYGFISGNISSYMVIVALSGQAYYWNRYLNLKKRNR